MKKKKKIDDKGYVGAVLMDLSKAFDTLNHDLLWLRTRCIEICLQLLYKQMAQNEN